jgi:hypothetical protein
MQLFSAGAVRTGFPHWHGGREMTDRTFDTEARLDEPALARPLRLAIPVATVWRWQVGAALLLVAAYLVTQAMKLSGGYPYFFGLVPMFDLDAESNLPSFLQAQGLLACAIALLFVAQHERAAVRPMAHAWLVLSLAFLYLGADEAAMLHDRMGPVAMQTIGSKPNHIDWVLPMGILASAFALYMIPFLLGIERATALAFALSGAVYVGGAVGVEVLGKILSERYGYESYPYVLSVALEEGMEMLGVAMFLRAILRYMARSAHATLFTVR